MNIFRRSLFVLPFLTVFAGLTGEAAAQIAGGRSGMSTDQQQQNIDAFGELNMFGHCYAMTRRHDAFALLATDPGSREESRVFDRMIAGENSCLSGGTRMSLSIVYARGVIAEALFERGDSVPANLRLPAPAREEVRDLGGVARCYAAGHRAEVQALLAMRAGSAEEVAAVSALWNDFRACMPQGTRVRLNAPWIRFLLAEAMLRLAPSAPTPS